MAMWMLASVALAKPCKCDPALADRVAELEAQNAMLVERIAALEERPIAAPVPVAPAPPTAEDEQAAATLLKEAAQQMETLAFDEAKATVAQLMGEYPKTRAARAAERLKSELAVVGRDEEPLQVERWFQGSPETVNANSAKLLVFFETWCPHCRREVPKLEQTWKKFGNEGLTVVAFTKLTRNVTEEDVEEFIEEHKLTYAVAKEEDSAMSTAYGVRGIPAAAIVRDGTVIWRGHPAKITDDMLRDVIAGR